MQGTVLQVLSQRPDSTGSGTTLDALSRCAAAAGWDAHVVAALPHGELPFSIGGLPPDRLHALAFGAGVVDFPIPGMSDVMPYPSTRFSEMTAGQLGSYRQAWRGHLEEVVRRVRPSVIHSHHVWLLSSMLKSIAPAIPVVTHCHATGLRQLQLCPDLAEQVLRGCGRNDHFVVLHAGQAERLGKELGVDNDRIHVIGAGFRADLFHLPASDGTRTPSILYAGKFSEAKGLPSLLDAFEQIVPDRRGLRLHVAGGGSGPEADRLRRRMERMSPDVVLHGRLSQSDLAELMRRSTTFVLPSFFEGLPLVLVEALACGCRLVCTELDGGVAELATRLGPVLRLVPAPRLARADQPLDDDLPKFAENLSRAIVESLDAGPVRDVDERVASFTWDTVFRKIEAVWRRAIPG